MSDVEDIEFKDVPQADEVVTFIRDALNQIAERLGGNEIRLTLILRNVDMEDGQGLMVSNDALEHVLAVVQKNINDTGTPVNNSQH